MVANILTKIFKSKHERDLKKLQPLVRKINQLESAISQLPDSDFPEKTAEFKEKLKTRKVDISSILPEAFALVREAAKRVLNMRHYDVQLIGGIALYQGEIAEMRTGEGENISSYFNCLFKSIGRQWSTYHNS